MNLSPRELEISRLVATGSTNKGIADRLGLSPATIKSHLRRIFAKLGAVNRAHVAAKVSR